MPRLRAFLRAACHGSAPASFPALLPMMAAMPATLLGPAPDVPLLLLDAVWEGLGAELQGGAAGGGGGRASGKTVLPAAAAAYCECLSWTLGQACRLAAPAAATESGGGATVAAGGDEGSSAAVTAAYCNALLQGSLMKHVVPLVLPGAGVVLPGAGAVAEKTLVPGLAEAALQVLVGTAGKVLAAAASALPAKEDCGDPGAAAAPSALSAALAGAVAAAATAVSSAPQPSGGALEELIDASSASWVSERLEGLLWLLRATPASQPQLGRALASRLAAVAGSTLLRALEGSVTTSSASGEASWLLSRLVRSFGASVLTDAPPPTGDSNAEDTCLTPPAAAGTADVPLASATVVGLGSLVRLYLSGPAEGPAAAAHADLIAAFLQDPKQHAAAAATGAGGVWKLLILPEPEAWGGVLRTVAGV